MPWIGPWIVPCTGWAWPELKYLLIWLLKSYRALISPLYGNVCRYHPSCSTYALEAVSVHGAVRGSWLAVTRLAACHPWAAGGVDPVPPRGEHPVRPRGSAPIVSTNPGQGA